MADPSTRDRDPESSSPALRNTGGYQLRSATKIPPRRGMLQGSNTKQALKLYPQVRLLVGACYQSLYEAGRHCGPQGRVLADHTFLDCRKYLLSRLVRKGRKILGDCVSHFSKGDGCGRCLCSPALQAPIERRVQIRNACNKSP